MQRVVGSNDGDAQPACVAEQRGRRDLEDLTRRLQVEGDVGVHPGEQLAVAVGDADLGVQGAGDRIERARGARDPSFEGPVRELANDHLRGDVEGDAGRDVLR